MLTLTDEGSTPSGSTCAILLQTMRRICNRCNRKRAAKFFREGRKVCRTCENDRRAYQRRRAQADADVRHGRLPTFITAPYFRSYVAYYDWIAADAAEAIGISEHVYRSAMAPARSEKQRRMLHAARTVRIDDCDKLCLRADFNLNEMFDDLEEWVETGKTQLAAVG